MRTKALILAAAATAVAAGSLYADPVYSVNVVGFVNKNLSPGWSMLVNPFNAATNYVTAVLANVPDNTMVYTFDSLNHVYVGPATYYSWLPGWDLPNSTDIPLGPGVGFWIHIDPATVGTSNTVVTFVGEVPQGTLNTTIRMGYNMVGSQVPQQGALATDLGYVPGGSDFVYKFINNGATPAGYDGPYTYYDWMPGWDPSEPLIGVGEGFWLYRDPANANTSWARTFTVQ